MRYYLKPMKMETDIGIDTLVAEAATVFADDLSATFPDPDHSIDEKRCITFGVSCNERLLVVAHTDRGDRIRIISAREMTRD